MALDNLIVLEPDSDSPQFRIDIGPELGIATTHNKQDELESIPINLGDANDCKLLSMLNAKQKEFHAHIMHKAIAATEDTLAILQVAQELANPQ